MKESLPVPYIHHHIYSYVYCLRVAKNMTHAFGPAGVTSKFGILKTCSHRAQHIVLLEVDAAPSSNSSFCQPLEPSRSRRSPRSHTLARLSFGTTLGALLECIRINQEWPSLSRTWITYRQYQLHRDQQGQEPGRLLTASYLRMRPTVRARIGWRTICKVTASMAEAESLRPLHFGTSR